MKWSDTLASSKAIDGSKGFMKKNKNRKQNCRNRDVQSTVLELITSTLDSKIINHLASYSEIHEYSLKIREGLAKLHYLHCFLSNPFAVSHS